MELNFIHLRSFYYLCLYGNRTDAVRKMRGYSIRLETFSRHLCQLKAETGYHLYHKRTFKLTPLGEKLYELIKPIFRDLPGQIEQLGNEKPLVVRLGAAAVVFRDYLSPLLQALRQKFPSLQLKCKEGSQQQIEALMREKALDLAVTMLSEDLAAKYESERLAELHLALLVPIRSQIRSANELWKKGPEETLITMPPDNTITRYFCQGLQRRGIDWPIGFEVDSIELVESSVAKGLGLGVSLAMPGRKLSAAGVRALLMPGFPRVPVGIVWQPNPNSAIEAMIAECGQATERLMKGRR